RAARERPRAASAIPRGELVGSAGESQVDRDSHDLRRRVVRRRSLKKILVPVLHRPIRRRGARDARESERGSQDVLAEARVGIFRIEGIDQERKTLPDWRSRLSRIERRRGIHLLRQPETAELAPERLVGRKKAPLHANSREDSSEGRPPNRRWRVWNSATAAARSAARKSGHIRVMK